MVDDRTGGRKTARRLERPGRRAAHRQAEAGEGGARPAAWPSRSAACSTSGRPDASCPSRPATRRPATGAAGPCRLGDGRPARGPRARPRRADARAGAADRRLGPADLSLAEDLAGRAAIAIDNARLYRDIQEADRRKNEFLAMLAHELRNPLAPIRNAVEILQQLGLNDGDLGWASDVIDRQVEQMVRLVDDLLDVSRITRRQDPAPQGAGRRRRRSSPTPSRPAGR